MNDGWGAAPPSCPPGLGRVEHVVVRRDVHRPGRRADRLDHRPEWVRLILMLVNNAGRRAGILADMTDDSGTAC